jgi:protein-tyrosine phosphatase
VSFRVLFVCTGNVCRSPLAERYLRARLRPGAGVRAASAGLRPLTGRPMDPASAQALRELGGDDAGHVARALEEQMVLAADLVLGAATPHRDAVLRLVPAALRRTFTLKEFARLAAGLPGAAVVGMPAPDLVAAVAGQRGRRGPVPAGGDDIADPFGRDLPAARAAAGQTARAVDRLLILLGAAPAPR